MNFASALIHHVSVGDVLILLSIVVAVQTIRGTYFKSLRYERDDAEKRARAAEKENTILKSKTDLTIFLGEQEEARKIHSAEVKSAVASSESRIILALSEQAKILERISKELHRREDP